MLTAHVGDRIFVESAKLGQPGREGKIEKVVEDNPPRYQVRWADGRTTIFAPTAGVARIEPKKRKKATKAS
jgi:hypothetical protein